MRRAGRSVGERGALEKQVAGDSTLPGYLLVGGLVRFFCPRLYMLRTLGKIILGVGGFWDSSVIISFPPALSRWVGMLLKGWEYLFFR